MKKFFIVISALALLFPIYASAQTVEEAKEFLAEAESRLEIASHEYAHAAWIAATYITYDSQRVEATAYQRFLELSVKYANAAASFNNLDLDFTDRRKMELLKQFLVIPSPSDSEMAQELAEIGSEMGAMYGAGEYCRNEGITGEEVCYTGDQIENLMRELRDPDELLEFWAGWRENSIPMKPLYERQVEIGNMGAQELGYDNLSTFWRAKYDMGPDAFAADADVQWAKVKPFYDALHCHVRAELSDYYGPEVVPPSGPIPAHVLGNQWAQDWSYLFDIVKPESSDLGYDLDQLVQKNTDGPEDIVRIAENFFISLGFDPLPETFWERSMFSEPEDHKAVCHASAWDLDDKDDLRIKMCIDPTAEEFRVVHHELGHNFYQRAYKEQPPLFAAVLTMASMKPPATLLPFRSPLNTLLISAGWKRSPLPRGILAT